MKEFSVMEAAVLLREMLFSRLRKREIEHTFKIQIQKMMFAQRKQRMYFNYFNLKIYEMFWDFF